MKTINASAILFLLAIPTLFFAGCARDKNPTDSQFKSRFAIYFLQDANLTYMDAIKQSIDSLQVSSPPIAAQDVIDNYQIFKYAEEQALVHAMIFKKDMKQVFGDINRPFIIIANGERIYIGEYWANFMNTYPPDIIMHPYKNNEFHLLSNKGGTEKINDHRIINCLNELGIKITYRNH
jgi:hypothetical protein